MKIINSPIFSVSPDIAGINDPVTRGLASKSKAVAQAKKIARKRDRARMRPLVAKELLQEHLTDLAEQAEAARQEREYAY